MWTIFHSSVSFFTFMRKFYFTQPNFSYRIVQIEYLCTIRWNESICKFVFSLYLQLTLKLWNTNQDVWIQIYFSQAICLCKSYPIIQIVWFLHLCAWHIIVVAANTRLYGKSVRKVHYVQKPTEWFCSVEKSLPNWLLIFLMCFELHNKTIFISLFFIKKLVLNA